VIKNLRVFSSLNSTSLSSSQSFQGSFSLATTPTAMTPSSQAIKNLQRKKDIIALNHSRSSGFGKREYQQPQTQTFPSSSAFEANLKPDLSIQYRYLLNKLAREKTIHHVADRIEPLSINRTTSFTLTKFSK